MHNLTVGHTHTYYVFAGATPILVHNGGCKDLVLGLNSPGEGIGSDALANQLRQDGMNVTTYNGDPWGNPDPATNNTLPMWIGMLTIEDAARGQGTDWELTQLIRMISFGDRELNSVEFYLGGANVSAALRTQLPKTIEGWKEFRGI